jgi:hypothetical protein
MDADETRPTPGQDQRRISRGWTPMTPMNPRKINDLVVGFRIQPDATVHRFQYSIGMYRRASAAK